MFVVLFQKRQILISHQVSAIYLRPRETGIEKLTHGLKVRSLFVLDDRGIDGDFAAVGILSDGIENLLQGRGLDGKTVLRAIGDTDPGVKKPQIIIYLRHGSDRGTRIVRRRLLIDGDGWGKAVDGIDVRLRKVAEKLSGIARERLHIASLPLGKDRIEGQRGFSGSRHTRKDDEGVFRYLDIDILEVVFPRSFDDDIVSIIICHWLKYSEP